MRPLLLCLLLLTVSGCTKNHDELRAHQAVLDRQLAEAKEIADNLNEQRKAIDALDVQVKLGLQDVPGAREAVAHLDDEPLVPATLPETLPPLPPESVFEGSKGAEMRRRISDTEQRLVQLSKVLGEVYRLQPQKKRMQQKLEIIERLRAQQK